VALEQHFQTNASYADHDVSVQNAAVYFKATQPILTDYRRQYVGILLPLTEFLVPSAEIL
jgi:hypothetical protein